MNNKFLSKILFTCSLLAGMSGISVAGPIQGVGSILAVPTLGGSDFRIHAMNDQGELTGYSYLAGNRASHAFRYSRGATIDLGGLGGISSEGLCINNSGLVAGSASLPSEENHAFLFDTQLHDISAGFESAAIAIDDTGRVVINRLTPDWVPEVVLLQAGTTTLLGDLGGGNPAAWAMNQQGAVVGESWTELGEDHAFLWQGGQMLDLGTLGGSYSAALAVNDANVVVGESYTGDFQLHAFMYAADTMLDLGTFGGTFSTAKAVNNSGQVIGNSTTEGESETHGFIYENGTLTDLGKLGGYNTTANDLNNFGQVVGMSETRDGRYRAFVWAEGEIMDLNQFLPENSGWELQEAQFINDAGQVAGVGLLNGVARPFLMTLPPRNRPPVANAGANQTVDCAAPVLLDASLSTDPDGDVLTYEWSEGGVILGTTVNLSISLPVGTHEIVLTVKDPLAAASQANLTVMVTDTTAPTLSAPAALTLRAGSDCRAAVPDLSAQIVTSDNCASSVQISQTPAAGTWVGLGETTVVVTASDPSGNSTATEVKLNVLTGMAPVVQSVAATPNVLSPPNHQMVPVTVSVVASDPCGTPLVSKIVSITCNEPISADEAIITGDLTADLAASRNPGSEGRIYTLVIQSTNAGGLTTTTTTTVTVPKGRDHTVAMNVKGKKV